MAEFVLQENPQITPRQCYFCTTQEGPFVNTFTTDPLGRQILMCAPKPDGSRPAGCAGQLAVAAGGVGPEGVADYEQQLAVGEEIIADLRARLAELEPLAEVRDRLTAVK